jgi:hypothetical protein
LTFPRNNHFIRFFLFFYDFYAAKDRTGLAMKETDHISVLLAKRKRIISRFLKRLAVSKFISTAYRFHFLFLGFDEKKKRIFVVPFLETSVSS